MMKVVPIADLIAEKISGEWGTEPTNGSGTNVLRTTNFTNQGSVNFETVVKRVIDLNVVVKKKLRYGDTIIEKSGGSPKQPVGRVVFFNSKSEEPYLCNNFTAILRPKEDVAPNYFFWALYSKHLNNATLRYQNKTTGILNLKLERYLEEEKVNLPDLKTQQKIANVLEQAEAARQKRRQATQLTEQFLQSAFLEMFGDPVKNEKGWEVKNIEDIASKEKHSIKAGPFGSALKKEFYVSTGYKIYGQEQVIRDDFNFGNYFITEEKYKQLESNKIKAGDILISLVGTYGKISIVPEKFEPGIINPRLMKISLNKKLMNPIFFKALLTNDSMKSEISNYSHGGTMDIVNVGIMRRIKIPLTPLPLQQKFARLVERVEQLRAKQRQSEIELDNLFNSLMGKYFG